MDIVSLSADIELKTTFKNLLATVNGTRDGIFGNSSTHHYEVSIEGEVFGFSLGFSNI